MNSSLLIQKAYNTSIEDDKFDTFFSENNMSLNQGGWIMLNILKECTSLTEESLDMMGKYASI